MKNKVMSMTSAVITGIGIGMPIAILCMILIGGYQSVLKEFIVWIVASALFGVVSQLFFNNSKMNLILSTVLHCLCCLIITICAGAICGYSDNIISLFIGIAPVFIVVYAVIYFISILSMKAQAKKVNESLKDNQQ